MKFSKATIIKQIPQTRKLTHIEVECDPQVLKSFTTPGQYVVLGRGRPVRLPNQEGEHMGSPLRRGGVSPPKLKGAKPKPLHYYAMSNPPGEKHLSFLIKNTGEIAKNILNGKNPLLISPALGNGFATSQNPHQNILLVGVGSCFGVFRSLILYFFSTLQKPHITFLYGAKTAGDIPYQKEIENWGVGAGFSRPVGAQFIAPSFQFLPTLSKPDKNWKGDSPKGLTGHVQTHFDSVLINAQTSAYLCGMKVMIEDCQKKLIQKGLSPHSIFLNY